MGKRVTFSSRQETGTSPSPAPWTHPLWWEREHRAMPRPLKEDPRDVFKTFRFTHAEVTRLEGRARASGRTLSSSGRFLLRGGPGVGPAGGFVGGPPPPATVYSSG